jgi:uncharacterized membrane protein YccC
MARVIDVDNLDVDSVAHLRQRPWLVVEAREVHGVDDIEDRMREVEEAAAAKDQATADAGQYGDLNIKALRELATNRQLDKSGNKAELVLRLEENDAVLASSLQRAEAVSINEGSDSVLGDSHPVPGE